MHIYLIFPQILSFIYSTVLIFILIYFECRETERQQFAKVGTIPYTGISNAK